METSEFSDLLKRYKRKLNEITEAKLGKRFSEYALKLLFQTLETQYQMNYVAEEILNNKTKPPYFHYEIKKDLETTITYFDPFFQRITSSSSDSDRELLLHQLDHILNTISIENLLIIMGMRFTSTSIINNKAFPPNIANLIETANQQYNDKLSIAARALTKHSSRKDLPSAMPFWGEIQGSPIKINKIANTKVKYILQNFTWWNCYVHQRNDVIFEFRLPSAFGARWKDNPLAFVGFVDPVDPGSHHQFITENSIV